ncbi:hypothetical protein [Pseudalkalibacillus caeni]|uniref:Uncharacterized protein n=1 Tax=Exobacillus caeni TaxID=2574798 RepID=A0A5R9F5Y1_9BACL|nr:hypothetical protein [Pseudalkalibacillus caeni]TLS37899.1 hypothetical protein FCL54_08760 [Pseudalkalibacillus caeni]
METYLNGERLQSKNFPTDEGIEHEYNAVKIASEGEKVRFETIERIIARTLLNIGYEGVNPTTEQMKKARDLHDNIKERDFRAIKVIEQIEQLSSENTR